MVPHDPWATDGRENARLMAYCKNFSVKYEDLLNVPRLVTAKTVILKVSPLGRIFLAAIAAVK